MKGRVSLLREKHLIRSLNLLSGWRYYYLPFDGTGATLSPNLLFLYTNWQNKWEEVYFTFNAINIKSKKQKTPEPYIPALVH